MLILQLNALFLNIKHLLSFRKQLNANQFNYSKEIFTECILTTNVLFGVPSFII